MALQAGKLREIVDVMQPADAIGSRGQQIGHDTVYIPQVPCSIETLNGSESDAARQVYAEVTHRVRMYGDPSKPLTHAMYLKTWSGRKLNIGFINDVQQNGVELELLCGEVVE